MSLIRLATDSLQWIQRKVLGYGPELESIEKQPVAKVKGEIEAEKERLLGIPKISETINSIPGISHETRQELLNKTLHRLGFEEIRFQINIDKITEGAYLLLEGKKTEYNEPDIDWYTRFFGIAKEISNDEMQKIWSSILAREIEKPGSVSLYTLDVLKKIGQKEAILFNEFCNYTLVIRGSRCIFNCQKQGHLIPFNYEDLIKLEYIGLINLNTNSKIKPCFDDPEGTSINFWRYYINYQNKLITLKYPFHVDLKFKVFLLTIPGIEIFNVINNLIFEKDYLELIVGYLRNTLSGYNVQITNL